MKHWIVVTSINEPTESVERIAKGATSHGWKFVIAGDTKSPDAAFAGRHDIDYLSYHHQVAAGKRISTKARERSYTRKMFGYLHAMENAAAYIIDTDDDNWPKEGFFLDRDIMFGITEQDSEDFSRLLTFNDSGWLNIYRYFAPASNIWPRGFPLSLIGRELPVVGGSIEDNNALVLQGLADGAPDIDAVHRFVYPGVEFKFDRKPPLQLSGSTWCPFNSQNTTWARDAFVLMYLPATCSFRMTDIYRGYVTQRILLELRRSIIFHDASVHQDRNEHQIIKDFRDEVMNYCDDGALVTGLASLDLAGKSKADMLRKCYEFLVEKRYCSPDESEILEAWISDCAEIGVQ